LRKVSDLSNGVCTPCEMQHVIDAIIHNVVCEYNFTSIMSEEGVATFVQHFAQEHFTEYFDIVEDQL